MEFAAFPSSDPRPVSLAMNDLSGVLVVDKPAGLTSHDVVARVRKILHIRQAGHFGTLDPFATGVLPLALGKATRFAQFYLKSRKSYEGTIRFGFATDTYDATGQPAAEPVEARPDRTSLEEAMREFTGRIRQIPPSFSAKRVGGVRAYELARQRKDVRLEAVEVEIYALELLEFQAGGNEARFAVECSGGTYVRSLAHDLGTRLRCPAHLAALRRTAVAEFSVARAITLEQLEQSDGEARAAEALIPMESLLPDCPELVVRGREEKNVRNGHSFELARPMQAAHTGLGGRPQAMPILKVVNGDRRIIAVARCVSAGIYHPDLVLA